MTRQQVRNIAIQVTLLLLLIIFATTATKAASPTLTFFGLAGTSDIDEIVDIGDGFEVTDVCPLKVDRQRWVNGFGPGDIFMLFTVRGYENADWNSIPSCPTERITIWEVGVNGKISVTKMTFETGMATRFYKPTNEYGHIIIVADCCIGITKM